MLSRNNLLKFGYFPVSEPSPVVIDSNELIEKKLRELEEQVQSSGTQFAEFPNNLEASDVARLLADTDEEGLQDGFESGIQAEIIPNAKQEAERIMEEARQEAEAILENARAEAQEIKQSAYEKGMNDGKKAGYDDGARTAMVELQDAKMQLVEERKQLQETYEMQLREMEPLMAEALSHIYEHLIHVSLHDKSEVILHLLEDTIHQVEGCKSFIIHVSRETYEQVKEKKAELIAAAAGTEISLEVIEDFSLTQAECLVETENGIYDCSLDAQLSAVREQIGILAYQGFEQA